MYCASSLMIRNSELIKRYIVCNEKQGSALQVVRNICNIVTIRVLCSLMKSGRILVKFWTQNLSNHRVFLSQVAKNSEKIVAGIHSFYTTSLEC